MINLNALSGKPFAVILVDYTDDPDGEWYVVQGVAIIKEGLLFVDRGVDIDFPIPEDTYDRIKAVGPDIASIVGDAEFFVTLTVGPIPDESAA